MRAADLPPAGTDGVQLVIDRAREIMTRDGVVSASEIAAWEWCPESWRLAATGMSPENQTALARGRTFHARTSAFVVWSRRAMAVGGWLLVAAAVLAFVWYFVSSGGR